MKRQWTQFLSLLLCLLLTGGTLGGAALAEGELPAPAAEVPAETPAETLMETRTDEPAETPAEVPAETPPEAPTDEPAETPTDEPAETPTDEPAETPTDEPTDEPTVDPAVDPTDILPEGLLAMPAELSSMMLLSATGSFEDDGTTYTYSLNDAGDAATLTGFVGKVPDGLRVPTRLPGDVPVVEIAANAFAGATMVTLIIPGDLAKIGNGAFKDCTKLDVVNITGTVEAIGANAFEGCTALTEITIASGAKSVGASAFKDCAKLRTVKLPAATLTALGSGAFEGTSADLRVNEQPFLFSLKDGVVAIEGYRGGSAELEIPETLLGWPVTAIAAAAFKGSTSLTSVVLPDGLKSIGALAFADCAKLVKLRVPDSVESIYADAFEGCVFKDMAVTLDSNTGAPYDHFKDLGAMIDYDEEITEDMFSIVEKSATEKTAVLKGYRDGAAHVLHLVVPETVDGYSIVAIDESAFAGDAKLLRLTVPGSVRQISTGAFEGCASLESVTILSGVATVGPEAFKGCGDLRTVSLSDTLTILHETAFEGCDSMRSFAGNGSYIYSLNDASIEPGIVLEDYFGSAVEAVVPDAINGRKVVGIGAGAFRGSGITSVALGANVRSIGDEAFRGEESLESVALNAKLLQIGDGAFAGCAALTAIELPDSLLSVGAAAFSGTKLAGIVIPRNVSALADDAFDGAGLASIAVDSANTSYVAIDDVLYTKDSRELVRYFGAAASLELPSGIRAVRACAFRGNAALRELRLCEGLTSIGAEAFAGTALTAIYIPDSVTAIAEDAFLGATTSMLTATVDSDEGEPYRFCTEAGFTVVVVATAVRPTSVSIPTLVLGVGETFLLEPEFEPEGATASCAFKSSSTAVASVDANGKVTARKVGVAILYVETDNGCEATSAVAVMKAPTKLYLSDASLTLGEGQLYQLEWLLSSGAAGAVSFSSSNSLICEVNADGLLEAVGVGTAVITARTYNNRPATCVVTVKEEPEVLTLDLSAGTLGLGQTYVLKGTLDNGQGVGGLFFTSDNPAVAGVNKATGLITARRVGFATITVAAYNAALGDEDLIKTFAVAVVPAPTSVRFERTSGSMAVGQTYLLPGIVPVGSAAGMTYKSSKTSVATVSQTGLITGKKAGTAVITVTTHNGKTASCKVTVKKAPSSIKLNASSAKLGLGRTYQLSYKLTSGTMATVTYTSSDESVATVSAGGLVTVVGSSGATVVTARTHNNKRDYFTVYAYPEPADATLEDWYLDLGVGESFQLIGSVPDADGNEMRSITSHYKLSSSAPSVVSVSSGGKLKAKKAGSSVITMTTYNGHSASCLVVVSKAPSRVTLTYMGISMNNRKGYMYVGDAVQMGVALPSGSGGSYIFASSNSKVVSIDRYTGEMTAHKRGTATIGVKTYNGKIAKCKITVR